MGINHQFQLEFGQLGKSFGRRLILDQVRLDLHSGACYLLSGDNGAGKSTLLRIIAGLEKPDSGWVNEGSGRVSWRKARKVLLDRVVYLHQQPYMFDGSVRRNLEISQHTGSQHLKQSHRINDALKWAGLAKLEHADARSISSGERQRVALARAWLTQPDVFLLDEPSTNMDQQGRLRTIELLSQLKNEQMSLVIASHDSSQFEQITDQHIHLKDAKLLSQTSTDLPQNVSSFERSLKTPAS